MEYSRIPIILKRYTFEEKMRMCYVCARKTVGILGLKDYPELIGKALPWDLETFLLFSIKSNNEYDNGNFLGKNIKKFVEIINTIKSYVPLKLKKYKGDIKFADYIMVILGSIEFDIQENYLHKYYRYNYFFNFINKEIDMKKIFFEKFGFSYIEFIKLGWLINIAYNINDFNISERMMKYVIANYNKIVKSLTLSREKYCELIDTYSQDIDDYWSCLRPSYTYPFVEYKDIVYFPLPYSINRAVTNSMLYRMTENNNKLRTKIGKEVIESYVYDLFVKSSIYDEVIPEKVYYKGKNKCLTPDVMCRKDDEYLLVDCKSFVPKLAVRIIDENAIESEIKRLAEGVEQVYHQLKEEFNKEYNFFKNIKDVDEEKIWGMLVVLEEFSIRPDLIYEMVANNSNLKINSPEYDWLRIHVKVVSIANIENFLLYKQDIINQFKLQKDKGNPGDFPLSSRQNDKESEELVEDYLNFKDYIFNQVKECIKEIYGKIT